MPIIVRLSVSIFIGSAVSPRKRAPLIQLLLLEHSNELELLISRVNDSRPIKGYSLLLRSRPLSAPPPPPATPFLALRRGRGQGDASKSLGHGSAGSRECGGSEKTTDRVEERVRSDGKTRAARERRGVNHDFGGILARDGMRFPPSSFFPSFLAMLVFPLSCLLLSLFLSPFRVPRLVYPLYPLAFTINPNPLVHSALRVFSLQFSIYCTTPSPTFALNSLVEHSPYPLRKSFLARELFILSARKLVQKFTDIARVCVNSSW